MSKTAKTPESSQARLAVLIDARVDSGSRSPCFSRATRPASAYS